MAEEESDETMMFENYMILNNNNDNDNNNDDTPLPFFEPDNDTDLMMEPTPIDTNSVVIVNQGSMADDQLFRMSKQDVETCDLILQTFSSTSLLAASAATATGEDNKVNHDVMSVPKIITNVSNKMNHHPPLTNTFVSPIMSLLQQDDNGTTYSSLSTCTATGTSTTTSICSNTVAPCSSWTSTFSRPLLPIDSIDSSSSSLQFKMMMKKKKNPPLFTLARGQGQGQYHDQDQYHGLDLLLEGEANDDQEEESYDDDTINYVDFLSMNQDADDLSSSASSSCSVSASASSSNGAGGATTTTTTTTSGSGSSSKNTARTMHIEVWNQRYQELVQFKQTFGHCLVPLTWPLNPSLGHWVKRQRYQFRIKHQQPKQQALANNNNKIKNNTKTSSTLTKEREQALELLGFTWDSHASIWQERFQDLCQFQDMYGNCQVPKKCHQFPQLSIWIKCQRRQYKLWKLKKRSHMTLERIQKLESIGFCLDPTTRQFQIPNKKAQNKQTKQS